MKYKHIIYMYNFDEIIIIIFILSKILCECSFDFFFQVSCEWQDWIKDNIVYFLILFLRVQKHHVYISEHGCTLKVRETVECSHGICC